MNRSLAPRLEQAISALPAAYPGPGGAAAVVRAGEVLVSHAWGWANAERRIPFTTRSLFRMCSITKQFTCALVLDALTDPSDLDGAVEQRLPHLAVKAPTTLHLCHNQSGLRDYWAIAMLMGSPAEAPFGDHEAERVIGSAKSLQFEPGARYSYANQNFRILSDCLQDRTGRSFAENLRRRIFEPVGMQDAFLAADTRAMPDGAEGYEGSPASGFRAAENRIIWTGDAGLGASLEDMIAWERYIDSTRDQADGLYRRMSRRTAFADGAEAAYGFGLARGDAYGRASTGHGGALRGWRSHRLHLAKERLSVVVLFNHLSDAYQAAMDVLGAVLGVERPKRRPAPTTSSLFGPYIETETGLSVRIGPAADGAVQLRYGQFPERLDLDDGGGAYGEAVVIEPRAEGLVMQRSKDNLRTVLQPLEAAAPRFDVAGRWRCEELEAELAVVDAGGALYGAFSGWLGQGRMELLTPVGVDVWVLPCVRALDHTPPGDFTLRARRGGEGEISTLEVGCWLARGLRYERRD